MNRRAQGAAGEAEAEKWLRGKGAKVLERNYLRRGGEIDLIVRMGDVVAFVEVKQRTFDRFGTPGAAVDARKQRRIARTALLYIQENHLEEHRLRFDVMEVTPQGIRHIEGAFDMPEGVLE